MRYAALILLSCSLPFPAAERFPKPNPAAAFRSLKVFNGGSPIRTAREDWDRARRAIASDPAWAAWAEAQRTTIDDWIEKRADRVEWVAGWHHDFVSPKDGSFLTWSPDPPGDYLSSPSDPRVKVTPLPFAPWVFRFRSQHASRMEEAAQMYRLTGKTAYADWVAAQLDFYANNYEKWPVQTRLSKSRIMAQSLDEAVNLVRYVQAARLIWPQVSGERRKLWRDRLFIPEVLLLDETMQRVHNIACWQRSAQAQVALLYQDDELWNRAIGGPFGIRRQIADGVTPDYLWFEQSLGYNSYVVTALLPLFTYATLAGRGAELRHEMESIENLMLAPIQMRFPTGQLPNPADITGGPGRAPNHGLLASAYRIFPTAIGLSTASAMRNWNTLIDPPPPAPESALPEVASWNMEATRMAILRKGPWQVYFHYGQLDASHAQAEALNYEAFHGDTDLTHDPGTVGYGSPLHTGFYKTALAHNVPMIDGLGQERWQPGELIAFDGAAASVSARQPAYRKDGTAERTLKIDGNRLIDELKVTRTSPGTARLGLALHLQGTVQLPDWRPTGGLPHWSETKSTTARDKAEFLVRYPGKRVRITVSVPGEFKIVHGFTADVPPQRRESLYFEVTGQ